MPLNPTTLKGEIMKKSDRRVHAHNLKLFENFAKGIIPGVAKVF